MIKEPVFKTYDQNQPYLIPPNWNEKIDQDRPKEMKTLSKAGIVFESKYKADSIFQFCNDNTLCSCIF